MMILDEKLQKELLKNSDLDKYEVLSGYRAKHYSLEEFLLQYATSEEFGKKFIRYCEILILSDGSILVPIACGHMDMLRYSSGKVKSEVEGNLTSHEISWYHEYMLNLTGSCLVWKEFQHLGSAHLNNENIHNTLKALERLGILIINIESKTYLSEEEWLEGVTEKHDSFEG